MTSNQHLVLGLAFMTTAQLCFCTMVAALKWGALSQKTLGQLPPGTWEGVGMRCGLMTAVCLAVMATLPKNQWKPLNSAKNVKWLIIRGAIGALSMVAVFYGGLNLPLSTSSLLLNTSVFFVALLAYVFLGETLSPKSLFCMVGGFSGICLILIHSLSPSKLSDDGFWKSLFDHFVAASAGLLSAIAMFSIRKMKHLPPVFFIFSLSFGGLCLTAIATAMGMVHWEAFKDSWAPLSVSAISGVIGQFFLTYAYRLAPAGVVSFAIFTGPVFSVLMDASLFSIMPDTQTLVGLVLVVFFGIGIARTNLNSNKGHHT